MNFRSCALLLMLMLGAVLSISYITAFSFFFTKPEIVFLSCTEEISSAVSCTEPRPRYAIGEPYRAQFRRDYVCPVDSPVLTIVEQGNKATGACDDHICHHKTPVVDFDTNCGCSCRFVLTSKEDSEIVRSADVVIRFFDNQFVDVRTDRNPHQISILFVSEATAHYTILRNARYTSQFNYSIGHRPWDEIDYLTGEYLRFVSSVHGIRLDLIVCAE
jgi:hypothetical protein